MLKAHIQNKQTIKVVTENAFQLFIKVVVTHSWLMLVICLRTIYATTNLYSPYGLLQRMKEFETKAIFFRRPLNEFTSVQEHCSYPLAIFGSFVNK